MTEVQEEPRKSKVREIPICPEYLSQRRPNKGKQVRHQASLPDKDVEKVLVDLDELYE